MKTLAFIVACMFSSVAFGQKAPRKDYLITINTSYGTMNAVLHNSTPKHKANFLKLVKEKFYDGLLFHRVIDGFMVQGGDPTSKNAAPGVTLGMGNNGYKVPAEFVPNLFHIKGALAAARDGNPEKASSGCQFYIVQGRKFSEGDLQNQIGRAGRQASDAQIQKYLELGGTPHLDGAYTVFGQIISGLL
jgi:cyclophilin family peptidyl-prolyl cis-trans isomerase